MITTSITSSSLYKENLSNSILLNCTDNNFHYTLLLQAYEAYKSSNFEIAIEKFKQLNSIAQSLVDLELSCESLLNLAIMYYYTGKLTKAYHYVNESLELCESLLKKIEKNEKNEKNEKFLKNEKNFEKNEKNFEKNENKNLIRIYLRILSNLIMISISMNLCDDSLSTLDTMIEYIKNLTDKFLKNEFFEMILKNFFVLPIEKINSQNFSKNLTQNFPNFNTTSLTSLTKSSANLFLDNNYDYGGEIFLLLKSVNAISYGFINFLKNEKNIDFFLKNLQEAISNLNLINDHTFVTLPLINLSLLKLIKQGENITNTNSREIFRDFLKIFRNKMNFTLDEEAAYSLVINEQFQKFETAKIIYESLILKENFFKENSFEENFSENIFLKLILKKLRNDVLQKIGQVGDEEKENQVNISTQPLNEELSKLNLSIQLLENFKYSNQIKPNNDQDYNEVEFYYKNNLQNLMIIYRFQKLKRFFKLFMKRTLIYDDIKDYRLYVKRSIREPALKKYFFTCLENFRGSGYSVTKFNFSSAGKKEKFMKFESEIEDEGNFGEKLKNFENIDGKFKNFQKNQNFVKNEEKFKKFEKNEENQKNQKNEENCFKSTGMIIFSTDKKFKSDLKKIPLDKIKRVIFGVHTNNLKLKYSEFQKEKYKKPWLFLSLILKSDLGINDTYGSKNSIFSKKSNLSKISILQAQKNYTSIDLFFNDENEVKEIIFSFNLLKYLYGLKTLHVISNKNYIIQKLKLKMVNRVREYKIKCEERSKTFSQAVNSTDNSNSSDYSYPSQKNKNFKKSSLVYTTWSFTKLFLYIIKNNIKLT
jgi:hypothetical protein